MRRLLLVAALILVISGKLTAISMAAEKTEIDAMIEALEKAKKQDEVANPKTVDSGQEQNSEKPADIEEKTNTKPQDLPSEQKNIVGESETTKIQEPEEVVLLEVFSPEFMASLRVCREDKETKNGRTLEVVGLRNKECYLTYGNYVLKVPVNVLTNIHSFDDLQTILKNKDMARYKYVPEYTYEGLVFALAACADKERFYGVEEQETRVDAMITRGLSSDYYDARCEIYLQNELELEGEVRDYGVTCIIEQNKLENLKPYFAEVAEKYKNVKVIESHKNKEILNADVKLMHYLQQNNYCKRNNVFLDQ